MRGDIIGPMAAPSDTDLTGYSVSKRILVFMPSWVGDVVMATPTLAALRAEFPDARLDALLREPLAPLLEHCPWVDRVLCVPPKGRKILASEPLVPSPTRQVITAGRRGVVPVARWLRGGDYNLAVLLPNSFRSAMVARMARIHRRVGYDRDGRSLLLTDRLLPRRVGGRFVPVPAVDYYLAIARYLGAHPANHRMALFTDPQFDDHVGAMLEACGITAAERLVIMTPGANYGAAKLWPLERFAAVADRCHKEMGLDVAVAGSPRERAILDELCRIAETPVVNLQARGFGLPEVMSTIKRARLVISNDTGPRHIAAAFGTPVVSIFGPTDPAWTDIGFEHERQVMEKVFCGPCQLKRCPLDHRCMTRIDTARVVEEVRLLLADTQAEGSREMPVRSP